MPNARSSTVAVTARQLVVQDPALSKVCEGRMVSWLTPMQTVKSASAEFEDYTFTPADEASMNKLLGEA